MTRRRIRHVPTKTTTTPLPASELEDTERRPTLLMAQALAHRDRANEAVRLFVEAIGADMNAWTTDQLDRHDYLLNEQISAYQKVKHLAKKLNLTVPS